MDKILYKVASFFDKIGNWFLGIEKTYKSTHTFKLNKQGGKMKSNKCLVCGKTIDLNHPAFWGKNWAVCMNCEGSDIEVWRISLPNESGGYVEHDFKHMAQGLEHIEVGESLQIYKEKMKATKYIGLPDFQGF